MNRKGVSYDVGRFMGINWRPVFDLNIVRRELEIIKRDLHCNAVRICAKNIDRLLAAAEIATGLGLEVWLSPEDWDKSPEETLAYVTRAAVKSEELRKKSSAQIVFSVGSEATLFMRGIVEGRNFAAHLKNPNLISFVKSGAHNKPLNEFLARATSAVREVFHGKVTYASLIWEAVNWDLFDYVGVDHYRVESIEDRYIQMLKPALSKGKPVVITEFGYGTCHDGIGSQGFLSSAGLSGETSLIPNHSFCITRYLSWVDLSSRILLAIMSVMKIDRQESWLRR